MLHDVHIYLSKGKLDGIVGTRVKNDLSSRSGCQLETFDNVPILVRNASFYINPLPDKRPVCIVSTFWRMPFNELKILLFDHSALMKQRNFLSFSP